LTGQQRLLLLDTWRRSGLPAGDFAALVGVSKHTLYKWKKLFQILTDNGPQYVTWRGKSQFTKHLEKRGNAKRLAGKRSTNSAVKWPRRPNVVEALPAIARWHAAWAFRNVPSAPGGTSAKMYPSCADARLRAVPSIGGSR
jgi:hypothetical protein